MNLEQYPKIKFLNDGMNVILCFMAQKDTHGVAMFFMELPSKEMLYVRDYDLDPRILMPWPKEVDFIRVLPILALSGNRIVGIAMLYRNEHHWDMHLGNIRITVSQECRRKGLGRILAGELYRNSQRYGLEMIDVEIIKDQVEVCLFYNRLGFLTETCLDSHYVDEKGNKHDVIIMSNSLKQLWKVWVEHDENSALRNIPPVQTNGLS
jgi:ribosomal protein S18 acetylase RimI-like enzyme